MSGCSGTWACGAKRGPAGESVSRPERFAQATEIWQEAYRHQMQGELDRAIELYRRSIEVCPTAEAHTFLGWTYSFQGRMNLARIHVKQGRWWDALREFEGAVRLAPGDTELRRALHSLRGRLN